MPLDWVLKLEVHRGLLAAFFLDLVGDLLALIETIQSRSLYRADMDEHVLAAAVG